MMRYIATFYSHYGAIQYRKNCEKLNLEAVIMPVPRDLSSSCGTCVRFALPFEAEWANEDLDAVYVVEGAGYRTIFQSEE